MMNIYQRTVLILGAIALIIAIWTSPRVHIVKGTILKYNPEIGAAGIIDVRTATMRAVSVMGPTILIFFALKSKSKD
jgi:hypothetical protein